MNLKTARKRAHLTQVALAARVGMTQPAICALEAGKVANPAWHTVKRISDVLGVRPERLFPVPKHDAAA